MAEAFEGNSRARGHQLIEDRTARRYRTVEIRAGRQLLSAEDPLSADLRDALALTNRQTRRTH